MHPKVLETAEIELRETESRKCQALQQFRDWIEKHPFLVSSKRDDLYLLIFLRLTKYNVDKACQRYEKNFVFAKKYPHFFSTSFNHLDKCLDLMKSGFLYPVPGFDDEGCKVMIMRVCERDPDKISILLVAETARYVFTSLMCEDENQICKYIIIFDFSNVTMKHMLTPMDNKILIESFTSCNSMRVNKFIIINASSMIIRVVEFLRMLVSEKLKKRSVVLRNLPELGEIIKPISMLPTRYGGNKCESEITADFSQVMLNERESYKESQIFDINMEKLPKSKLYKDEFENIGSFMKLEID